MRRFQLDACKGFQMVYTFFPVLRQHLDTIPQTLTYNDFYYTNLALRKDETEALMYDYNLLGKGSYVSDIQNVTYWFTEEKKRIFFEDYGEIRPEDSIIHRIVSPIVSLYSAMSRGIFPGWAKEALRELDAIPRLIEIII